MTGDLISAGAILNSTLGRFATSGKTCCQISKASFSVMGVPSLKVRWASRGADITTYTLSALGTPFPVAYLSTMSAWPICGGLNAPGTIAIVLPSVSGPTGSATSSSCSTIIPAV